MSSLFNKLPDGCFQLSRYLNPGDQGSMLKECRKLVETHPLMQPTTKSGFPMALKVSSWGKVGWFGRNGSYSYIEKHDNGLAWPEIPRFINNIMMEALIVCKLPQIELDTVLMNWYPPKTGRLGKHADVTEQDQESPIITISLGSSCKFLIGGLDYDDPMQKTILESGDVFVMSGASRLAYHEVQSLIPDTNTLLPSGGRISLTGRKVYQ